MATVVSQVSESTSTNSAQESATEGMGESYPCTVCSKVLKSKNNLERHLERVHQKQHEDQEDQETFPAPESCPCEICGKALKNEENLAKHKDKVHGVQSVPRRARRRSLSAHKARSSARKNRAV